jgi:hypothetical protein
MSHPAHVEFNFRVFCGAPFLIYIAVGSLSAAALREGGCVGLVEMILHLLRLSKRISHLLNASLYETGSKGAKNRSYPKGRIDRTEGPM